MADFVIKVLPPKPPNFLRIGVDRPADGTQPMIRVADLNDEQKDQLAKEWRASLDVVADRQRKGATA